VEEFSLICVVSAVDALRSANRLLGKEAFRWEFVSHDGSPIHASNGITVEVTEKFGPNIEADYLFVCASILHDPPYRQKLHAGLRQLARRKIKLGAFSVGTYILARAGLLDGHKCTIHWELQPAFQQDFPEIECISDLYVIDRDRFTSSGGVASMELMLRIIEVYYGEDLCLAVANQFHLDRIRNEGVEQRSGTRIRMDTMPALVQLAVRRMARNNEFPLAVSEIASDIGTSTRSLERLFKLNLNTSPGRFYLSLRLEKAKELLMHTNLSTLEIALQCGFSSASYFSRCFQREFGRKPSATRN